MYSRTGPCSKRMAFRLPNNEHLRCLAVLKHLGYGWDWSRLIRQSLAVYCTKIEAEIAELEECTQKNRRHAKREDGET